MQANWDELFSEMVTAISTEEQVLPSVSQVAQEKRHDPFRVLIATIISLRTKDAVTLAASERLFALADTPHQMVRLVPQQIEQAIHSAGFYRVEAANILRISQLLIDRHDAQVPANREALLALPGVGVKTANLTLNLGFGIDAICVDTHVHRIANRMGWITTRTPEESEKALEAIMPKQYWIPLNEVLVSYGQKICKPISPLCSTCRVSAHCQRNNVTRSR